MSLTLASELADLPDVDAAAASAVRARAADILRPAGALQRLDELAEWVAGWHGDVSPRIERPAALIFAGDHGVAAAGVSKYPVEVTAAMLAAYGAGKSTISAFANAVGATVAAVDVGVGRPTADIRTEPAMTAERFDAVCEQAAAAVRALDADLLVIGEMGIGNTTAAAAVVAAVFGGAASDWVGRGTGVDDEGLVRKTEAVAVAVHRATARTSDPLELLREVGGTELVAMAAAIVAARKRRLPVVLDGYVVAAAAAPLCKVRHDALDHCVVGHRSAEPGHRRLLDVIAKEPLLDLGMRLGEGSGAMAAVPLIRMACAGITEVPTFAEWFGPPAGA